MVSDLCQCLHFLDFQLGQRKDQPTTRRLRRSAKLTQERCALTTGRRKKPQRRWEVCEYKAKGGFWESLSHDQVGWGDGGGVQMSEQGNTAGAAAVEVGKKHSVV